MIGRGRDSAGRREFCLERERIERGKERKKRRERMRGRVIGGMRVFFGHIHTCTLRLPGSYP